MRLRLAGQVVIAIGIALAAEWGFVAATGAAAGTCTGQRPARTAELGRRRRAARRLQRQLLRLNETALLIDAHLANPSGWPGWPA